MSILKGLQEHGCMAHGCNAQGVMGAGVARIIRQRYPEVFSVYRSKRLNPGDVHWVHTRDGIVINMITQLYYGKMGGAKIDWIQSCVDKVDSDLNLPNEIAIPKIGCGLGGLEWSEVREIFIHATKTYHVYDLDGPVEIL